MDGGRLSEDPHPSSSFPRSTLTGNRTSVHRSPPRSTDRERPLMNVPVRKSTSWGSVLLPKLPKRSKAAGAARTTSWLFHEGSRSFSAWRLAAAFQPPVTQGSSSNKCT